MCELDSHNNVRRLLPCVALVATAWFTIGSATASGGDSAAEVRTELARVRGCAGSDFRGSLLAANPTIVALQETYGLELPFILADLLVTDDTLDYSQILSATFILGLSEPSDDSLSWLPSYLYDSADAVADRLLAEQVEHVFPDDLELMRADMAGRLRRASLGPAPMLTTAEFLLTVLQTDEDVRVRIQAARLVLEHYGDTYAADVEAACEVDSAEFAEAACGT